MISCNNVNRFLSLVFSDSEASTILGMQTIWFAVALVFLILSVAGLVTAAVLCFCRQRAATPRHPHNAHNAQTHPPVSFPCESQKAHLVRIYTRSTFSFSCRLLGRCSMCSVRRPLVCSTIRQSAPPPHSFSIVSLTSSSR